MLVQAFVACAFMLLEEISRSFFFKFSFWKNELNADLVTHSQPTAYQYLRCHAAMAPQRVVSTSAKYFFHTGTRLARTGDLQHHNTDP